MKKIILIIFALFVFGCETDINYEYEVVNDIFLELIGNPEQLVNQMIPLMPYEIIKDELKNYDEDDWKELDTLYYPFKCSSYLRGMEIDEERYSKLEKMYIKFADSLLQYKIENSKLLIHTIDTLVALNKEDYEGSIDISNAEYILNDSSKTYFPFSRLTNTGKYIITLDPYPDVWRTKNNENIEHIFDIRISRIFFNGEKNRAFFYFEYFKGPLNAAGSLIFVEKNKNWEIEKIIPLWVS